MHVPDKSDPRPSVLVLGVYLANKPTYVRDVVKSLSQCKNYRVVQRWVAIGNVSSDPSVGEVTCIQQVDPLPKFLLINRLLSDEPLAKYEYVVIVDDDIQLSEGFLDGFLSVQSTAGFSLAQPARTRNSFIDHPITKCVEGVLARQTLFVEIGPVTSVHRPIFHLVFPFDTRSPMGWGYENIWAYRLAQNAFKMGIVDAYPVDHSLRPPAAYYGVTEAKQAQQGLLKSTPHFPLSKCFTTIRIFATESEMARSAEDNRDRLRRWSLVVREAPFALAHITHKIIRRAKRIRRAAEGRVPWR